jgi:hypothetical protein
MTRVVGTINGKRCELVQAFRDPVLCLERRPVASICGSSIGGILFPHEPRGLGFGSINVGMLGPKWWESLAFLSCFLSPSSYGNPPPSTRSLFQGASESTLVMLVDPEILLEWEDVSDHESLKVLMNVYSF